MTGFPQSPKLTRAGLVLIDPDGGQVLRIITLQYASETLQRSLEVQAITDGADRSQPLRLAAPATETITLEAELDAIDQLETPGDNPDASEVGIFPALSALETMLYPTTAQLEKQNEQGAAGTLQIAPAEAPLALFIWSRNRIVPVRLNSLSITEESFDPALNPIRAKINLTLRVLSVDDLGFRHRGGGLFMAYLRAKEGLAERAAGGQLSAFGIRGLP